MAPVIRVDQSYCNMQLANFLTESNWSILFKDPGRATRGYSGTQEQVLGIFEKSGLPIPDIAAVREDQLLLIEVDKSAKNNKDSFVSYRNNEQFILDAFRSKKLIDQNHCTLLIGFCKVGGLKNPAELFQLYEIDWVAYFCQSTQIPTIITLQSSLS